MTSVFRKPPDSDRNIKASLYVGNLDPQVSEPLLYELFIQFAPVRTLNLPKDRILKTHQGYGFVEFRTIKDAEYALAILRGIRLYGKMIKLRKAEPSVKGSSQQQVGVTTSSNSMDVGAKIFIKNLNPLIDEQSLMDTFSKFGTLIRPPFLIRDSETGESKGYGFVSFDDFSSSDTAIEKMDGAILMNSKVSVAYAFKEDPVSGHQKKISHGDKVERLLAENAKSNHALLLSSSIPDESNRITKPRKTKRNTGKR